MALNFANDKVWINKKQYDAAETQYYESLTKELMNRKSEINCNGDANEFSHNSLDENSLGYEKSKKSAKNKNKANSLAMNSNCVEETTSTIQQPAKPNSKKNKKKNKSQIHKDEVDASAHCNNFSVRKLPNTPSNDSKRGTSSNNHCTLVSEIAKAREHIKNSLEKMDGMTSIGPVNSSELLNRIAAVEKENADLKHLIENLKNLVLDSQKRIAALEVQNAGVKPQPAAKVVAAEKSEADDDDGVDLFASDSDDESAEAARVREERLAAYAAKKSKKPALIAKSSLILDVKPWDDETDLKEMETQIRSITADGLLWGASKFVPVAFGIQKLSISCVVEDEKVSIDWLTEEIEKFEDFVQSVDVAAFNKI